MPAPQRDDPFKSFAFLVEIDEIAQAAFSEASGLESETAVIEYRLGSEGGLPKLPGLTRLGTSSFRRGITKDAELWNWRRTSWRTTSIAATARSSCSTTSGTRSSAGPNFAREPATRVTVAVECERPDEERRTTQVTHDLEIFRELA
jgi:T4-like virus tail tube protein gp19